MELPQEPCFDLPVTDPAGQRGAEGALVSSGTAQPALSPALIASGYRCKQFIAGKSLTGVATGINACI